jgi:photosystem II stability/assembly factor-like uncharacterized protein
LYALTKRLANLWFDLAKLLVIIIPCVKLKIILIILLLVVGFSHNLQSQSWTVTSAPTKNWCAVASSSDGTKLMAAVSGGGIYVSTNSGVTWNLSGAPTRGWYSIAASADGSNLVASATGNSAGIYTSTTMGVTWAYQTNLSFIESVASSTNGMNLLAAAWGPGYVYTSTNFGATWQKTTVPLGYWTASASSADGSKLIVGYGGYVYCSTDTGATWSQKLSMFSSATSVAVGSSADGNILVWAAGGGLQGGGIFVSTNAGVTWKTNTVSGSGLSSVAVSADGLRMVVLDAGLNYYSSDGGQNWVSNTLSGATLKSVASSADGTRLIAAVQNGGIYISQPPSLNATFVSGALTVSWPLLAVGWNLQVNTNLPGTHWTAAGETFQDDGTNKYIVVIPAMENRFYRLINQ